MVLPGFFGEAPMSVVFKTPLWSIEVPDCWFIDNSENVVALFRQDEDDWALVVSAFVMSSDVTMEMMRDSIQSVAHEESVSTEVSLGDFKGYHTNYTKCDEEGETAWRVWCLFCGDLHLYITYNCSMQRRGKNDAVVDEMLSSLTAIDEG